MHQLYPLLLLHLIKQRNSFSYEQSVVVNVCEAGLTLCKNPSSLLVQSGQWHHLVSASTRGSVARNHLPPFGAPADSRDPRQSGSVLIGGGFNKDSDEAEVKEEQSSRVSG